MYFVSDLVVVMAKEGLNFESIWTSLLPLSMVRMSFSSNPNSKPFLMIIVLCWSVLNVMVWALHFLLDMPHTLELQTEIEVPAWWDCSSSLAT